MGSCPEDEAEFHLASCMSHGSTEWQSGFVLFLGVQGSNCLPSPWGKKLNPSSRMTAVHSVDVRIILDHVVVCKHWSDYFEHLK